MKLRIITGIMLAGAITIAANAAWLQDADGPSPHFSTYVKGPGWHLTAVKKIDANVTFKPAPAINQESPFNFGIYLNQKTYPQDFEYDFTFVNDNSSAQCTFRMLHIYSPAHPHIVIQNENGANCTWGFTPDNANIEYRLA